MTSQADLIFSFAKSLWPGTDSIESLDLSPKERQKLGGHLFLRCQSYVNEVGRALKEHKDLYPDILVDGAALLEAQRRADAWKFLRNQLQGLLQLAQDNYVYEQSTTLQVALAVFEQVETEAKLPFDTGLKSIERMRELERAAYILEQRDQEKAAMRRQLAKERAQARGEKLPRKKRKKDRQGKRDWMLRQIRLRFRRGKPGEGAPGPEDK